MLDYWAHNGPPVYASVAGYLGLIKDRKKSGSSNSTEPAKAGKGGDLNELLKLAGPGGMIH